MNNNELRMLEILRELKEKFNILGVKSEFEAEGTRTDEIVRLNEIIYRADLDSYIKIGGCEAVRDIDYTRVIGAKGIMAPMIETPFAMKKFVQSFKKVYGEKNNKVVIINIETKTALENLNDILDVGEGFLDVVCVGRVDLSASLGLTRADINSDVIYEYVKTVAEATKKRKMIMAIGGGISPEAIPFLKKIDNDIDRFETRKIIFPKRAVGDRYNEAIRLSMEFEILYLNNKRDYYSVMANEDISRLEMLEKRFTEL
ncbi:aldolase/citrate lyase family protein [Clostridium sp. LP20]|uniref:aldolase/citrate lyase family protein n=1 Tax=Clostridium sp. LP20 TaxID=3418665 RepID=UPI003EE78ABF